MAAGLIEPTELEATMHRFALVCTVLAAVLVAGPSLAAPAGPQSPAEPTAVEGGSCAAAVDLESMSSAELDRWMAEAGAESIERASGSSADPPLCPRRVSCYPCQQGLGPCFLFEFGSDSCCTSPLGPCFQCPYGQTILITRCPCVGLFAARDCPSHDQDWFCG